MLQVFLAFFLFPSLSFSSSGRRQLRTLTAPRVPVYKTRSSGAGSYPIPLGKVLLARTLNTTHSQKYIFIFLPVNIADVGQRVSELIERKEEGITHLAPSLYSCQQVSKSLKITIWVAVQELSHRRAIFQPTGGGWYRKKILHNSIYPSSPAKKN